VFDFASSAAAADGQLATYGGLYPFDAGGPYWYMQDALAGWSMVPGPPWVSDNGYRGMAGYKVTPHFLFASDGQEWWVGFTEQ